MKRTRKPIPISAAKRIAKDYGYDQVVIIARKVGVHGVDEDASEHVTTYGVSKAHCESAALQGKALKRFMGWPEETSTTNAVGGYRNIASVTTESVGERGSKLMSYDLTEEGERALTVQGPCPEGGNHEFAGHDVQCYRCLREVRT